MSIQNKVSAGATAVVLALGMFVVYSSFGSHASVQAQNGAPRYRFDPDWPKPLPNKWKIGGITGLAVDPKDDTVWAYDRPNDLTNIELEAEIGIADCCTLPPSMIHFDKQGNVIGSFVAPQGHGMDVDSKGFAYLGQDTVRKYDVKTGKLVGEVPRTPEREPGVPNVPDSVPMHKPGVGGQGPVGGFLPPPPGAAGRGGRGNVDPAQQAARIAAFRMKYPPTTPMIVGGIEEIRVDEPNNELYAADNYMGGRIMVFDLATLKFKRGYAAYGRHLEQMSTDPKDRDYKPGDAQEPKEFKGHLTFNFSDDGKIYAADRNANRIQVFTRDYKFEKEFVLAPNTGVGGSTGGVGFSPDKAQKFLYISDLTNNHIWFLDRATGKVMGTLGQMGENGGEFFGLHMIAVDSKGVIYTGEVFAGERVQRFLPQ